MKNSFSLSIIINFILLITLFNTLNRAQEFVVKCCDKVSICSEINEDVDCGKDSDGCPIPYTCPNGIHTVPVCPNGGRVNYTCSDDGFTRPACELPDADADQ
ncbi:uncharacterized protein MELLADRAFT_72855 [Melampsora larici-populina 98AG31]|uniref:Secreted protein n=1 Tax=Melampsora larici-populina (strain 98AG31 / pathotype 3-4-7) TaxID=747676 RepID=F4S011_MELLP|nr:uncharacterized protein MELLADRAFT_72855 [Melampsora larici-populina 98AG31]EGG02018.1 secreted protein [Melampsora larici-populina 98AG31]